MLARRLILVLLVQLGPAAAAGVLRRDRRASAHHARRVVRHRAHHVEAKKEEPHAWKLPPLTQLFRTSEKTEAALEGNLRRLKASAGELRQRDLAAAQSVYEGYQEALTNEEKENKRLEEGNAKLEKELDQAKLHMKSEEVRKMALQQENKALYKQLEELKATVNNQVKGLEDILASTDPSDSAVAQEAPKAAVAAVAVPAGPETCRCTSKCSDLGWGSWCTVQSATCMVRNNCATGGAMTGCVTVDRQVGPWTRCANILSQAPSLLQVRDDSNDGDSDDDSDSDSDEDDDSESPACQCRTPCKDQGWGEWCYVQDANCRVKSPCAAGGAAGNKCVANDPAGPWTRCSNLLATPKPQAAVATAPAAQLPQALAATTDLGTYAKDVEHALSTMVSQVSELQAEDQQSLATLKSNFDQEKQRLLTIRDGINEKTRTLRDQLQKSEVESHDLDAEVDKLEGVNRSLHGQLQQLEKFLNHESASLHSSMVKEEKVATAKPKVLAAQLQTEEEDDTAKGDNDEEGDSDDDEDGDDQ